MVERPLVQFYRRTRTDGVLSIPEGFSLQPTPRASSESSRTFVSITPLLEIQSERPQDGGRAAWLFLFGACIVEAVSWGFPACFGVFREYYFTHSPFQGNTTLAVTGVLSDGCLQVLMPFLLWFLRCFPHLNKRMMWLGLVFCVMGSVGASIATQPWQIIASQGTFYGMGAGFLSAPVIVFMSEWFDRRQSFAYGIMFGASGLFGALMPGIYTKLLHSFGQRITLLSHGAGVLLLVVGAMFCIDHRIPLRKLESESEKTDVISPTPAPFDFWKKTSFWLLGCSILTQAFALNLPPIYLPSYITDLHYTPAQGAIALSLFNLATTSGNIGFGLYTDNRNSFFSTVFLSTIIGGFANILFWAEAKTLFATVVFAVIYGIFSGGFGILRSRFAATVVGDAKDKQQILMVLGIFTATRGAGNVAGGFMGQSLVNEHVHAQWRIYGLRKWMPLMLFIGASMLCAGMFAGILYLQQNLNKRRERKELDTARQWPLKRDAIGVAV
ncbi:hypothetical protein ACN47E_000009 [Coniothyrium glycines]